MKLNAVLKNDNFEIICVHIGFYQTYLQFVLKRVTVMCFHDVQIGI